MEELLKAIEELKRAYSKSGCQSVRISIAGDEYFECQVLKSDGSVAKIPHKQTNGEWLRGLSDEELAKWWFDVDECSERFLAWLRAEHKE